jgi:hypothetical protein
METKKRGQPPQNVSEADQLYEETAHYDYTDGLRKRRDQAARFAEELGSDAAHALLVTDSEQECRAVAKVLRGFKPLRLCDVECNKTNSRPKRTFLVAEITFIAVVLIVPQFPYQHEGSGKTGDLFLSGVQILPKRSPRLVEPAVFEFDFHTRHRTHEGIKKDRERNLKASKTGLNVYSFYGDEWDEHGPDLVKSYAEKVGKEIVGDWKSYQDHERDFRLLKEEVKGQLLEAVHARPKIKPNTFPIRDIADDIHSRCVKGMVEGKIEIPVKFRPNGYEVRGIKRCFRDELESLLDENPWRNSIDE